MSICSIEDVPAASGSNSGSALCDARPQLRHIAHQRQEAPQLGAGADLRSRASAGT
jgi:hypothetical protein